MPLLRIIINRWIGNKWISYFMNELFTYGVDIIEKGTKLYGINFFVKT